MLAFRGKICLFESLRTWSLHDLKASFWLRTWFYILIVDNVQSKSSYSAVPSAKWVLATFRAIYGYRLTNCLWSASEIGDRDNWLKNTRAESIFRRFAKRKRALMLHAQLGESRVWRTGDLILTFVTVWVSGFLVETHVPALLFFMLIPKVGSTVNTQHSTISEWHFCRDSDDALLMM